MKVLFLSPDYPAEMRGFTRGLAEVGAQVIGVGDRPRDQLSPDVRDHLAAYLQVQSIVDEQRVMAQILPELHKIGGVDRVETLWEPLVMLAARLREQLGAPGMGTEQAIGFRDKSVMKDRVRKAGLRVPKFAQVSSASAALAAARTIGYPVVIKPIAGAGTADTHGVRSEGELRAVLETIGHVQTASVEEYIDGEEFTYDAVSIAGKPVFESVAQYHPRPLESRNNEWISPAQIVLRDPYIAAVAGGVELGRGVLRALGMDTGFTHMEWFKKSNGEVVFGEIAARSPGAKLVDQMNYANDFDIYREWARSVCWQHFEATAARRYHVATVFKRAKGRGRISGVEGMSALRRLCGPRLVEEAILPIGHPRRNWRQTLLSDGYVVMRDPDYSQCLEMMQAAVSGVQIFAE